MVVASQRRRHSRWRMLFSFMIVLGLARHCELKPAKKLSDANFSFSSSSVSDGSSGTRRSQDLGSPIDLAWQAWQAWLLMDPRTRTHSSLDSASSLRRITPKSVFIAPPHQGTPNCPDDLPADSSYRCVKNVNINQLAHREFLLHQLNAKWSNGGGIFGALGALSSNNVKKQSSGPLQVNIPILIDSKPEPSKIEQEATRDSVEVPLVVVPPRGGIHSNEVKEPDVVVTTYAEKKNDDSFDENQPAFSHANSSALASNKDDQTTSTTTKATSVSVPDSIASTSPKAYTVVPVTEFADEANETNYAEDDTKGQDLVVRTYETYNETSVDEDEMTFYQENTSLLSSGEIDQSTESERDDDDDEDDDAVFPVADFIDDSNETSFAEIVDYKIPIDPKTFLNVSSSKRVNSGNDSEDFARNESQVLNSTEATPMLILLSFPTKSSEDVATTTDMDDFEVDSTTIDPEIVEAINLTANVTDEEPIDENASEFVPSDLYFSR